MKLPSKTESEARARAASGRSSSQDQSRQARSVACRSGRPSPPAGEQREAVPHPVQDALGAQHAGARGRQLDGQGQPIQRADQGADHRLVLRAPAGPLQVQADGVPLGQRLQDKHGLPRDVQRDAAGQQPGHRRGGAAPAVDQLGDDRDHLLDVVEHHQGLRAPGEGPPQHLGRVQAHRQVQRVGDGRRHPVHVARL